MNEDHKALSPVPDPRDNRMELKWSASVPPEECAAIENAARKGVADFYRGFLRRVPAHERLHRREDVCIQACILAVCAWNGQTSDLPAARRAGWLTAASHAVDDLVDAPGEYRPVEHAMRGPMAEMVAPAVGAAGAAREHFVRLAGPVVGDAWGPGKFDALVAALDSLAVRQDQRAQLFAGFNRLIVGSVLFKPGTPTSDAKCAALLSLHNEAYIGRVRRYCADKLPAESWMESVVHLLEEFAAPGNAAGAQWLGLTTKALMELFAAALDAPPNPVQDTLHSLLYAPVLYFHDIDKEVARGEMRRQVEFDTAIKDAVMTRRLKDLIKGEPDELRDALYHGRVAQREMARASVARIVASGRAPAF